jgi:Tfp pilus assembly protein PilN
MKRINLLPREVAVRRRQRQQTLGLVAIGVVFLLLLVLVWFFRQGQLRNEEERRVEAQARVQTLEAEVSALREFALLDQTVKQKEATLATAMAGDVAWSRLLIELSMIIPGDSWLTSFNGTAEAPAAPAAPGATAPARAGALTFSAITFDFPGVSKWITRLQELESLQNIWVPSAGKGTVGARETVNFSSTTDLSTKALSGRYQPGGPQ